MRENSITADIEFKKCIYIGFVSYLQKRLSNHDLSFNSITLFDSNLSGDSIYPLMRFCYDYYHSQIITQEDIRKTIAEYNEYLIYVDKTSNDDEDLKVIYSFYTNWEKDLNTAIDNINRRLDNINDISLKHYDRIINYLLFLKYDALLKNDNIDEIIEKIINNLKGRGENFKEARHLFSDNLAIKNADGAKEFEEIKDKVFKSLKHTPKDAIYSDSISQDELIKEISNADVYEYDPYFLLKKLDLNVLVEKFPHLSPKTINKFNNLFMRIDYYNKLSKDERNSIKDFYFKVQNSLENEDINFDHMQKLQINWLCKTIDENLYINCD